ncbi:hypothetical protein AMJ80_09735 [bacterium SM23_31]|nr:MAG: hypothetical protein AMJ80_09735 [bacterium SM23_31]
MPQFSVFIVLDYVISGNCRIIINIASFPARRAGGIPAAKPSIYHSERSERANYENLPLFYKNRHFNIKNLLQYFYLHLML